MPVELSPVTPFLKVEWWTKGVYFGFALDFTLQPLFTEMTPFYVARQGDRGPYIILEGYRKPFFRTFKTSF